MEINRTIPNISIMRILSKLNDVYYFLYCAINRTKNPSADAVASTAIGMFLTSNFIVPILYFPGIINFLHLSRDNERAFTIGIFIFFAVISFYYYIVRKNCEKIIKECSKKYGDEAIGIGFVIFFESILFPMGYIMAIAPFINVIIIAISRGGNPGTPY